MKQDSIFSSHNLYPYAGKIKEHYKELYDTVFVAFLPFSSQKKMNEDAAIRLNDEQIIPISWLSIVHGAGLKCVKQLNQVLKAKIGANGSNSYLSDLEGKINEYTSKNAIDWPVEGTFDLFSKRAMFATFQSLGKNRVVVTNEFYEKTIVLDLEKMTPLEFSDMIEYDDYYVYSEDQALLFAIQFDNFSFLIAADHTLMQKVVASNLFEGFLCDDSTENNWEQQAKEII